jgi:glycosyltransferase involved in cell wall biosynthesis
MNIVHVYKDYLPVLGGIENHIRSLAEAQAQAGHQVTVLVCNSDFITTETFLNGVRVLKAGRLGTALSMPISLAQPLALHRFASDITHIHSPYPLGELANWMVKDTRQTVITYHADVVRQHRSLRFYGPLFRRVLRHAARIVVTSPTYLSTSPWLVEVRDRCRVIPLGVDCSRFLPPERPRVSHGSLLFVGRLRYYKGLDGLLRALVDLPRARLTVVGDGPMKEEWQALGRRLGCADRVTFLGEVADEALPGLYRRADIFVLPANSRAEAFGTVLLEAMASGLPCITTEVGSGTSWVVRDGRTGIVVPPREPAALANAIGKILDDEALSRRLGSAGRERVVQHFSFEKMVSSLQSLYEEVARLSGWGAARR